MSSAINKDKALYIQSMVVRELSRFIEYGDHDIDITDEWIALCTGISKKQIFDAIVFLGPDSEVYISNGIVYFRF